MLKQDIIKLFITKNGINKNIIDEITKGDIENLEVFFNYTNLIEKELLKIEDEVEKQEALDIFYDNQNTLFKIGILYRIKSISRKNGRSVKEEFLYEKTANFFNILKTNIVRFAFSIPYIISAILFFITILLVIRYAKAFELKQLLILLSGLFLISLGKLTIAYIAMKWGNKRIKKNNAIFRILCQIENEILD